MSTRPSRLDHLTTDEAARAVEQGTVVVLPVGALEQHGAGLPLGTDTIRAEHLVDRLAQRLPELVVIGPTVPVGVSPHHLPFPGTMSLSTRTFVAVLTEYLDTLHRHGWRKVLVVTGHGGNASALGVLAQDLLVSHPDLQLAWSGVTGLAGSAVDAMHVGEVHGHSGEAETAQMLVAAPDLVRSERLERGTTRLEELDPLPRLSRTGAPRIAVTWDRLSANGVLGDPTRATTADGHAILDEAESRLVDFLKTWGDL